MKAEVDELYPWCKAHPEFFFRSNEACPACACLRGLEAEQRKQGATWKRSRGDGKVELLP
jgi:hypothetical protein